MENKILSLLFFGELSRKEIAEKIGTTTTSNSLKQATAKLIHSGLVGYLIPERPRSRLQKYHLTDEGRNHVLRQNAGNVP